MRKKYISFAFALFVLAACSNAEQPASQPKAKGQALMDEILAHYVNIQQTLAGDSTKGVQQEAEAIAKKADAALAGDLGEKAAELKPILQQISSRAKELNVGDLDKARAGFGRLSEPVINYVTRFRKGGERYFVAHCPMAGKSWVQKDKQIANPYYGSMMLRCGTIQE